MNKTDIPLIEKTLSDVEAAATAAHPAGEHGKWLEDLCKSLDTLGDVTKGEVLPRHMKEFEQIVAEDIVLNPKVDQRKEKDAQLEQDLARLSSDAAEAHENLKASDFKAESDERIEQLATKSIELVARFRQQRAAIESLLMEAIQRDRGFSS